MPDVTLAVLEGHWGFKDKAMSVAPLFDMVLSSHEISTSVYDYERWRTKRHLTEAITRHAGSAETIYLGGHAGADGIEIGGGDSLTPAELAKCIASTKSKPIVSGLYISMCSIGTSEVAAKLLKACPTLEWVAGYSAPVNWAESAAIDLLFFGQWFGRRGSQRIGHVADYMSEWATELARADDVGFNIYTRAGAGIADRGTRS